MKSIKLIKALLFVCLTVFAFSSCKDDNGNPTVEKPVLFATPTISNVGAGDEFPFSIDASGINKLTKLTVEETYGGNKRIVLDSTFNPSKTGVTFVYNYMVPDTATKDQVIVLVFSLTDEKGNVTTDTETFTVSYSTPSITLTSDKTEASVGDKVNFTANVTSPVPNLKEIEVTESKNGTLGTSLKKETLPANTKTTTFNYEYTIPEGMQVGQYINILVKATNTENVSATATKRIEIK